MRVDRLAGATGAGEGDCFAAACLHARLAARLDWKDALRFANCDAAISTTGLGAQSALPTADQVIAYLSATPART
jgi:sugar/nucleoside kinase (ribokinase family)